MSDVKLEPRWDNDVPWCCETCPAFTAGRPPFASLTRCAITGATRPDERVCLPAVRALRNEHDTLTARLRAAERTATADHSPGVPGHEGAE